MYHTITNQYRLHMFVGYVRVQGMCRKNSFPFLRLDGKTKPADRQVRVRAVRFVLCAVDVRVCPFIRDDLAARIVPRE